MNNKILEFYKDKSEKPLFYCESGSRLWGIASPDSDYDVRGIHLLSKAQYFGFKKVPDTLSKMDGLFDFESFSLDKFCQLLTKSNPNLLEWLRSDIVYLNKMPDWEIFRTDVLKHIDMSALYFHYLSIAKNNLTLFENGKKANYKVIFYAIRGLLSAELASQNILPELDILKLRDQFERKNDVIDLLENSIDQKRNSNEKDPIALDLRNAILCILKSYLQKLQNLNLPKYGVNPKLESVLSEYNYIIKGRFYLQ